MGETWRDRAARLRRDVEPYVPGLTRWEAARRVGVRPTRIAKLSSNENPLGPSPRAVAALRRAAREIHAYPPATAPALRATLARRLRVGAGQVVVGAGSSALLHAVLAAFTGPDGEVVTVTPGFGVYAEVAAIHRRRVVTVPLRPGDFTLDLEQVRGALGPRTEAVILARPNNPTSTLVPLRELETLAGWARELGAVVVSDEAYLDFADAPARETAVALVRGPRPRWPNVVVTRTLSKAFGLADLRVGYAVAAAEEAEALARANLKWPVGHLAEAAALAALADRAHLARTLRLVRRERARLARGFRRLGLAVVGPPQGNYLMVDVTPRGWHAPDFARAVLGRGHVLIRGDFSPSHVRVSVGRREENRRLLATLAALLGARE